MDKMLKFFFGAVCIFSITAFTNRLSAQLAPTQWREDLRYLQHIVHSKYSNLFHNVTEKQFDSAVAEVDKKIGTMSDLQMQVEMVKLVAMFRVGHTMVRQRAGRGDNLQSWVHHVPVRFSIFSDGLFIKSAHENYREIVGGEVVKIANTDVKEVMEKFKSIVSFENEQGFKSMLPFYFNVPEFHYALGIIKDPSFIPLTYRKNGKLQTVELKSQQMAIAAAHGNNQDNSKWIDAFTGKETPLWLKNNDRLRYFEYLPASKTMYVRHSGVQNEPGTETIEQFFNKVFRFVDSADVDKFILDIRMNGGGNNYLNKPVITGLIQSKKINRKGHLFVITGKATFSAAQNLTNENEKYTEVILAGEPTSENVNFYGDTRTEILPNSELNVNLSWLWWQNHDPRDKRQWTAPQLAAEMSFDDYVSGRDPVMEVIMNYRETEPIEKTIVRLVSEGSPDKALTEAKKYMNDPVHKYFKNNLEAAINTEGYNLMNQNRFKEANLLLGLNLDLFPNSANVYDSYAESLLKLGKREEAIKYYRIAIEKDPNGVTGENARNMIRDIESKKGF